MDTLLFIVGICYRVLEEKGGARVGLYALMWLSLTLARARF